MGSRRAPKKLVAEYFGDEALCRGSFASPRLGPIVLTAFAESEVCCMGNGFPLWHGWSLSYSNRCTIEPCQSVRWPCNATRWARVLWTRTAEVAGTAQPGAGRAGRGGRQSSSRASTGVRAGSVPRSTTWCLCGPVCRRRMRGTWSRSPSAATSCLRCPRRCVTGCCRSTRPRWWPTTHRSTHQQSAAELAKHATVPQLRRALSLHAFAEPPPTHAEPCRGDRAC